MARVSFVAQLKRFGLALAWIVAFLAVGVAVSVVLNSLNPLPSTSRWWLAVNSGGQALGFVLATWLVGRRLTKHSWAQMGWLVEGGLGRRIGRGVALGAGMAALAVVLAALGSGVALRLTGDWLGWLAVTVPLALGFVAAALTEELVFRGYPLRRLADALGPWVATGLLAVLFGLVHLRNPNAGAFGTINVALAAVWLSVAFFSSGGMGLAWGLHFGWNAALAVLFDAPVSGYRFQVPAVEYAAGRHAWVDGGAFGPEGGLAATLALVAGTWLVIGRRLRHPSAAAGLAA